MATPKPTERAESGMRQLIANKRILISVGSGGVGKTTTAAAIGILAAKLGRRCLVMTIDPARRLAASLGLTTLDHQQRVIPKEKMAEAGVERELLYAMMLDPRETFDQLIRRHARSEEAVARVMRNKLYRELSTRLAGGQEYAAMEMLYQVAEEGQYDLLVLDTPPTVNAFDFLEAPQKMVDLLDSPVVSLFVRTYQKSGKFSFRMLSFGATYVFRRLARFVGGAFLDDVAAFFADLSDLLEGFAQRASRVLDLLADKQTGFVLVTGPDPRSIDEAIVFYDRLKQSRRIPAAFVINRVHALQPNELDREQIIQRLARHGVDPVHAGGLATLLLENHKRMQILARGDGREIRRLKEHCGEEAVYLEVPFFDQDIFDISGLSLLAEHL
jgi:anion-transporting  ArsA/GET3 family ATPase